MSGHAMAPRSAPGSPPPRPRPAPPPQRPAASAASGASGASGAPSSGLELSPAEVPRHDVRLLVVGGNGGDGEDGEGAPAITWFRELPRLLRAGDLLVVNDAATLPGSLHGVTAEGEAIELRLVSPPEGGRLRGVLLGAGDYRVRTEHRARPPELAIGARIFFAGGALATVVLARQGRLVELLALTDPDPALDPDPDPDPAAGDALWQALYDHGAPVQYAHRAERLPLWSVQTAYAARPWAAEMPSAGRPLTWQILDELRGAGVGLARLTHAAGLSATGDPALDAALPWPERYELSEETARAIAACRAGGGRVIAAGTTAVRALEVSGGRAGAGLATLRLGPATPLSVVDAVVSGLHVPGESHFELLAAFAPEGELRAALELAAARRLSSHELGDACLVWRRRRR